LIKRVTDLLLAAVLLALALPVMCFCGGLQVQVHDPLANPADARHEYLTIIELDALRPADAVILAVGHGSYVEGGWPLIQKLLMGGSGLVLDIKMKFDRGSKPTGVELWRL
jgi:UDP-N-acetyl-D-galactosamine dehydrogenase